MSRYLCYKKIILIYVIIFYSITFCSQILQDSSCSLSCNPNIKTLFFPPSTAQNLYTQYHKEQYQKFNISGTYRFQQACNNNDIGLSVFAENPLLFTGTLDDNLNDTNRSKGALIPEYFGLGPDTNNSIYLSPQIRNQIIDLQLSFQGDHLWAQVNIPLVKGQWQINHIPIMNNTAVGKQPLEVEAQAYIYNIGQTFNAFPVAPDVPPIGTGKDANYNILPIITNNNTPPAVIAPVPPNYTGAYIVSTEDASDGDSFEGVSPFAVSDQNLGSDDLANNIYNEGFNGNSSLNADNWRLDIGAWPEVQYDALMYEAATAVNPVPSTGPATNPAALIDIGKISLTGSVQNVGTVEGTANTLQITQNQLNSASTFQQALSGEFDFNGTLKRLYNNFNFNSDDDTKPWGIADIIIWLGYDFCRDTCKYMGFYLHGVIPTGTNITQEWYKYTLNPIVGNGRHYQLGVGISGSYLFCARKNYTLTCNIDGYIDHVFASNQFRVFDQSNNPMSRYAIIKSLLYTQNSQDNPFDDDYEYQNLNILGNINNGNLMISNNFKGEFIIDLILKNNCFEAGFGYAFSGLSADVINCKILPKQNDPLIPVLNATYYGYKGNTAITNLIIMNITSGQEIFDPNKIPLIACNESNLTIACNYPVAGNFTIPTPTVAPAPPVVTTAPQGNSVLVKSCGDVTVNGRTGAYLYGESTGGDSNGEDYVGTTAEDVFTLPDIINNQSGLMNGQIINRIFGHIEYNWETLYAPKIGIVGSYGFGGKTYFTAYYWDLGFYIGCSF